MTAAFRYVGAGQSQTDLKDEGTVSSLQNQRPEVIMFWSRPTQKSVIFQNGINESFAHCCSSIVIKHLNN